MVLVSRSAPQGVSLVEMMVALILFSALVFPVAMITSKAGNIVDLHGNQSSIKFEIAELLKDLETDTGMTYRVLPTNLYQNLSTSLGLNPQSQIFMAYVDSNNQVKRIGYALTPSTTDTTHWQLMKTVIPENATINDYAVTRENGQLTTSLLKPELWVPVNKVVSNQQFYFTGSNQTTPHFIYCLGSRCNADVTPQQADGFRLQAGDVDNPEDITVVYKNSELTVHPLYFKLATHNPSTTRQHAVDQVYAFATAILEVNRTQHWMVEKQGITPRIPVETWSELNNSNTILTMRDMHYNFATNELLAVSNSTGSMTQRGFYIFKFKPGQHDSPKYELTGPSQNYSDTFPVTHRRDNFNHLVNLPNNITYVSVTQDTENYIYVLAKFEKNTQPNRYFVLKFTPEGAYHQAFNISIGADNTTNEAYGVTINPLNPNQLVVLMKASNGSTILRFFDKHLSETDAASIITDAPDVTLNATNFTPNGINWNNVKGITWDPVHYKYIFTFNNAALLSMDANLSTLNGQTPAQRAVLSTQNPLGSFNKTSLSITGVAYNPLNNMAFISYSTGTSASHVNTYYAVIPNTKLNTPG